MSPLTAEWVEKAEGDYASCRREMRARKAQNYDSACLHAQQCAEKYLKARLQEGGTAFPMTHNLSVLLTLVLPVEPTWSNLAAPLQTLSNYAVQYRYPGAVATRPEGRDALRLCGEVHEAVRISLSLPLP